jgi:hypothetical protein
MCYPLLFPYGKQGWYPQRFSYSPYRHLLTVTNIDQVAIPLINLRN